MEQLKNRYKKTEVVVLPDDWEVGELEEMTQKIGSGITPKGGETVYKTTGRAFIRSQNIGWGKLLLDDVAFIDDDTHFTFQSTEILLNDVFLNITGASIGRCSYANEIIKGGNVNQHVCIIRTHQDVLYPIYLTYILLSRIGQKQIDSFQTGGNRQGLNFGQIKSFKIPLPANLNEQKAIADALSDVDALIANLEELIAKKKAIKQGAMQQLLTPPHKGGKRLEGFRGDWETVRISDKVWFQEGPGVRKYQFTKSGVKLLNGTNINDGKLDLSATDKFISFSEAYGSYKHFLVDKDDILIACSGISIDKFDEKVTVANTDNLPLCMNTSTMRFKMKDDSVFQEFFYHFLKSLSFKKQIGGQATGSAQLNFGPSHVKKVIMQLPPKDEQKYIAQILNDMDNEIQLFAYQLSKFYFIKQGMMQELLTGNTRLI